MARAIIPKQKPITMKRLEVAMRPAVNKVQNDIEAKFRLTTRTWKRNIRFIRESEWVASGLDIWVYSQDIVYVWVSDGTRKDYEIVAKNSPFLSYRKPFRAKTQPGRLSSGKGSIGNIKVQKPKVTHPGIRARKFDVLVKKAVENKVQARLVKAFESFIVRTGH